MKRYQRLLPYLPLLLVVETLLPITTVFWYDMYVFLSSCGYFGRYTFVHWHIPETLNTATTVLFPAPVFYTYLILPFQGILSGILGVNLAFRVLIIGILAVQLHLIQKLLLKVSDNKWFAASVAIASTFTIYPFTNLFNRGAVNEFLACGFLTASVCCVFLLFLETDRKRLFWIGVQLALYVSLAFGIHPITTLYGGVFLGLVFLFSLSLLTKDALKKEKLLTFFVAGFIVAIIMAPWLYAILSSLRDLPISPSHGGLPAVYPHDLDSFATRFALYPFDKRSLILGKSADGPYIDLQANMPLLLLLVGFVFLTWGKKQTESPKKKFGKILFLASTGLFVIFSWMSLSSKPYEFLPRPFYVIQFVYRMITYQNLALLTALLGVGMWKEIKSIEKDSRVTALLSVCLTLVFINLVIKGEHAKVVRNPDSQPGYGFLDSQYDSLLEKQYPHVGAYLSDSITQMKFPAGSQILNFVPGKGVDYGALSDQTLSLSQDSWVVTNIAGFKWNTVKVDGSLVGLQDLRRMENPSLHDTFFVKNNSFFLGFHVSPGVHTVEAVFNPPAIWTILRDVSLSVFSCLLILFCCRLLSPLIRQS